MSFSFGFSGDDIEADPDDVSQTIQSTSTIAQDAPPPIPAQTHDLNDLVGTKQLYAPTDLTEHIQEPLL